MKAPHVGWLVTVALGAMMAMMFAVGAAMTRRAYLEARQDALFEIRAMRDTIALARTKNGCVWWLPPRDSVAARRKAER